MTELNNIELEFVTKCPKILAEEIVRPTRKRVKTVTEKLNAEFAEVASEINSYSVKNDDILRDMHKTAYLWGKDETSEIITEVMTAYCPVRMTKKDIISIIDNAINV